jgi:hypothetical protein
MDKHTREIIDDIKRMLNAYTEPFCIDGKKAILALKLCMELVECLQEKIDLLESKIQVKKIPVNFVDGDWYVDADLLDRIVQSINDGPFYNYVDETDVEQVICELAKLGYLNFERISKKTEKGG